MTSSSSSARRARRKNYCTRSMHYLPRASGWCSPPIARRRRSTAWSRGCSRGCRWAWSRTSCPPTSTCAARSSSTGWRGSPRRKSPTTSSNSSRARSTATSANWSADLNKLIAYAQLTGQAVSLQLAEEQLTDILSANRKRITIDEIQRTVCQFYRVDRSEMSSKRRNRAVVRPRQVAMYLAKVLTPRSYPEIGRKFGGRDHSTVIHAVRLIETLRTQDADMDGDVGACCASWKAERTTSGKRRDSHGAGGEQPVHRRWVSLWRTAG